MTLRSIKKVVRRSWGEIPTKNTVIAQVNALNQGQYNVIEFLDCKKRTIGELNITGVNSGETEAPHI